MARLLKAAEAARSPRPTYVRLLRADEGTDQQAPAAARAWSSR